MARASATLAAFAFATVLATTATPTAMTAPTQGGAEAARSVLGDRLGMLGAGAPIADALRAQLADLALAQALAKRVSVSEEQPVDHAVALVVEATQGTLAEAVLDDAAEAALTLPATGTAALERMPEAARPALAAVVRAFTQLEAAAASQSEDGILAAQVRLLTATRDLHHALAKAPPMPAGAPCQAAAVPPILSISLGDCDDVYLDDIALLVDTGGHDLYLNNAGGSNLLGPACAGPAPGGGAAALIDLSGDDRYASGRSCGANGGGRFGAGFLFDADGNDLYVAGDGGVNGGGDFGGSGFLVDAAGNDVYQAGDAGTNGGGGFFAARGFLLDVGGNDHYGAGQLGTNGGGISASRGFLLDMDGNDEYAADGLGVNGGADGGSGFLADLGGHDRYTAFDQGSNGGALLAGPAGILTGFLFDAAGDDVYEATWGATNGGGAGGAGLLVDLAGNDTYRAGGIATNGGAFSILAPGAPAPAGGSAGRSSGLLVDGGGRDVYEAGDQGVNGGAFGAGSAGLVDLNGDDRYTAAGAAGTNGGADTGLAGLLDLGGVDNYQDGVVTCTDCSLVPKGTVGAQVDGAAS